jgi:hypothetical protein
MFIADDESVLVSFQSLCEQYPRENVVALWEMAGGQSAAQQSVQSDEVPECDCNSAFGFHEVSCAQTIYYAALRR